MTDTIDGGVNAALAKLQTQLPRITKDNRADVKSERTGAQYSYNYADLAQISALVLPLLGGVGLSFTARPTIRESRFVLVYELRHAGGESIDGEYPLPNPDRSTPQEIGSAITYARRYCLCAVTGAAPDEDDDAATAQRSAATSRRRGSRAEQPAQQPSGADGKQPPINGEQTIRLQKAFQALGISANADKAAFVQSVIQRPVTTSAELTQFEAGRVIKKAEQDAAKRPHAQPSAVAEPQPVAEAQAPA